MYLSSRFNFFQGNCIPNIGMIHSKCRPITDLNRRLSQTKDSGKRPFGKLVFGNYIREF